MRIKIIIILTVYFVSVSSVVASDLRLPAILGSNMVLQQQSSPAIWGWAKRYATISVKVNWMDKVLSTTANEDGKWEINISTPKAGGPYEIIISGDTTYVLRNVMIGEVWVCSGQSNMRMTFSGHVSQPVIGSNDYIAHGNNYNIRLFTVEQILSTTPLDNCNGNWSVSNPKEVANFSAVAYVFGKYIQEVLNVPIGLIQACYGGSTVESWTEAETLGFIDPAIKIPKESESFTHKSPTVLYNGMLSPILNYGIRGIIWYQGEANVKNPEQYLKLFPAMIQSWRARWEQQNEFPFYFVQIAPYNYDSTVNSAQLREVQLKTTKLVQNTGMAVTLDIGDENTVHPPEKVTVGKRLAYIAIAETYSLKGIEHNGPTFKEMKVEGNNATLVFDFAPSGLSSFGKPVSGFTVAGDDQQFYEAQACIKGKDLIVSCEQVDTIVAVRYCWENFCVGSLYNNAGLPASSFRTDNWKQ